MSLSDADLETLVGVARSAGEIVAARFEEHRAGGIQVDHKGPDDPVTAADRDADALIGTMLATHFPDVLVVSEEGVPRAPAELAQHQRMFWVDPLDGTMEFVARRTEFAVMIGVSSEGRASAGVIVIPMEGLTLAGVVGRGAWFEDGDGRHPMSVSSCKTFGEARMVVSRSHQPPLVAPLQRRLGITHITRCGSVGVKVARIALAQADLYVHEGFGIKRWDSCAPEAILQAAGGRFSDLDGNAIDYAGGELPPGILATNGLLHAGVLSAVEWARREVRRLSPPLTPPKRGG